MKIFIAIPQNWKEDTYLKSKHSMALTIRRITKKYPQHTFVLIGNGSKYKHFKIDNSNLYIIPKTSKFKYILSFLLGIALVLTYRPKLIFISGIQSIIPYGLASFFARSKIIPVVNTEVSYYLKVLPTPISKIYNFILSCIISKTEKLLVISNGVSKEIIKKYKVIPEKISLYRYPISNIFNRKISKKDKNNFKTESPRVLFVGRMSASKGLIYLIEASKIILKKMPKIKFIIKGATNSDSLPYEHNYEVMIKNLITKYRLQKYFTFLKWSNHSDIPEIMAAADTLVLPSITEGLGLVILEAMACGTPVIASDIGGIPDIITHRKNGLLVKAKDPQNLAYSIIQLFSDRELKKRVIENGFKTVRQYKNSRKSLSDFIINYITKFDG